MRATFGDLLDQVKHVCPPHTPGNVELTRAAFGLSLHDAGVCRENLDDALGKLRQKNDRE